MNIFDNLHSIIELHGSCLFVSDVHFNVPPEEKDFEKEEKLINLLLQNNNIDHLFLLGDIFDFWFEYDDVVPKGYFKLFNFLHNLNTQGVKIHFFTGNHDMWVRDYFTNAFGAVVYRKEQIFVINEKKFLIGHGDGLGGKQRKYNLIKKIFAFKPNQFLYSTLHPKISFSVARSFSQKSRKSHKNEDVEYKEMNEPQILFSKDFLKNGHIDFFIFGHRHIPFELKIDENSVCMNTGDWMSHYSYISFKPSDESPELAFFNTQNKN